MEGVPRIAGQRRDRTLIEGSYRAWPDLAGYPVSWEVKYALVGKVSDIRCHLSDIRYHLCNLSVGRLVHM